MRAVAERLGVPIATLRSWSRRYGVGPLEHTPGRHRLYSESDIAALEEMNRLIGQGSDRRSAARSAMEARVPPRAHTADLQAAAFDLDTDTVGRTIERHLLHCGVLDTWDLLVRPMFAAIESRQRGSDSCIDVEHALSWTVSRCLQRIPMAITDTPRAVLLACTENETHTLPLEALRAALCERGRRVLMLGADVPAAALTDALTRQSRRTTVVLWAQSANTADAAAVESVLAHAATALVAGPGWEHVSLAANVAWVRSLHEALRRLPGGE